ncbi:MAG: hypothetical protein ABEJ72_03195, partial [Candidatus Aenigmatarchaeota archaeon]
VDTYELSNVLSEIEEEMPEIAAEGHLTKDNEATLLTFLLSDERTGAYTISYARSLYVLDKALQSGGKPYSIGMYFPEEAEKLYGTERVEKLEEYKEDKDPNFLFNPGKIVDSVTPVFNMALKSARAVKPFTDFAEKMAGQSPGEMRDIPGDLSYESFACTNCGYCRNVCTLFSSRQWESASWQIQFSQGLHEGRCGVNPGHGGDFPTMYYL